jgi:hypothetical protein
MSYITLSDLAPPPPLTTASKKCEKWSQRKRQKARASSQIFPPHSHLPSEVIFSFPDLITTFHHYCQCTGERETDGSA